MFQYKADQGDCKKCMGTKKFDKLEVYVRGTENVDWEGRDPGKFGVKNSLISSSLRILHFVSSKWTFW